MKKFNTVMHLSVITVVIILSALGLMILDKKEIAQATVIPEAHSTDFQRAFFEASEVYGKIGCGDQNLAEETARRSIQIGLSAKLIAAQIGVESGCNSQAISNRGAVGLTQVVPKMWNKQFDFSKVNLFNPEENMNTGTQILSDLIKQYGIKNGLIHYYGTGVDGNFNGVAYADKILQLAGRI
jgi:hypothetical protein